MNEAGIRDPNNAIARGRQHNPAVDRDTGNPPKHRPGVLLPRWGGRLFALGAFLLLAAGLSLGAWRHYSQHQEVMATAAQDRDFVPRVRVATVEPTGADVNAFFGIRSSIIAAPTGVKVFNWLFTMFRGRIVFKTPMLSAIGFIVHVRHRRPDRRIPAGAAGRFRGRAAGETLASIAKSYLLWSTLLIVPYLFAMLRKRSHCEKVMQPDHGSVRRLRDGPTPRTD
jgi:hypothetical protein